MIPLIFFFLNSFRDLTFCRPYFFFLSIKERMNENEWKKKTHNQFLITYRCNVRALFLLLLQFERARLRKKKGRKKEIIISRTVPSNWEMKIIVSRRSKRAAFDHFLNQINKYKNKNDLITSVCTSLRLIIKN